jgi:hypothetical protein
MISLAIPEVGLARGARAVSIHCDDLNGKSAKEVVDLKCRKRIALFPATTTDVS